VDAARLTPDVTAGAILDETTGRKLLRARPAAAPAASDEGGELRSFGEHPELSTTP